MDLSTRVQIPLAAPSQSAVEILSLKIQLSRRVLDVAVGSQFERNIFILAESGSILAAHEVSGGRA